MKLGMYTVRDEKVNAYLQPFTQRSNEEAIRAFKTSIDDPQTNFNRYPEDYHLFKIGEYDENTGVVTPQEPTHMAHAVNLKKGRTLKSEEANEIYRILDTIADKIEQWENLSEETSQKILGTK